MQISEMQWKIEKHFGFLRYLHLNLLREILTIVTRILANDSQDLNKQP